MIKVDEHIFRGPRPQSLEDLRGYYGADGIWNPVTIKTLLDLETGFYDRLHPASAKAYRELEKSITEVDVPLSNVFAPSKKDLDLCLKQMKIGLHPLYIHCRYGKDRTGIVCAYYRVKVSGFTKHEAIDEMYRLGFHGFPYALWIPSLIKAMAT